MHRRCGKLHLILTSILVFGTLAVDALPQTGKSSCSETEYFVMVNIQDEEALADCLMAVVHMSAQKNQISPRCLCSRKDLDALIKGKRDLAILSGWRNELAGKQLLKFLSGDSHLSFSSGKLELVDV